VILAPLCLGSGGVGAWLLARFLRLRRLLRRRRALVARGPTAHSPAHDCASSFEGFW
jgi:hypothetical protein